MNHTSTIFTPMATRISLFLLAGFLVMLPFDRFYSQLLLVAFTIHTLIHAGSQGFRSLFNLTNLLLSSVFLANLISMTYSADLNQGWKDLTRQLAILVIPLFFSLSGFGFDRYRRVLLQLFTGTCVLAIIYLYADAFRIILYYRLPLSALLTPAFINHNFSSPIGIHATYLSLYAAIALVHAAVSLYDTRMRRHKWITLVVLIILAAGLLQLASRSILTGLGIALTAIPFVIFRGKSRWRLLLFVGISLVLGLILILGIDSLRSRYVTGLKQELVPDDQAGRMEPRAVRWATVWEQVRPRIITGHGNGSEKRILKDAWYEKGLYNSFLHELNAHNQYLSIWLRTGLWGLILYFLTIGFGFYASVRNRDATFLAFMILVTVLGFSENFLDVNKGIFFYAFFFSFFVFSGKPIPVFNRLGSRKPT